MKRCSILAVLITWLAGATLTTGQSQEVPDQPQPTFKAQVEYVEVDALVTDQSGEFVRDLRKEDFQVFEDGRRQTISAFAAVDIPMERADRALYSPRVIEPDVRTNERPFDGRVYVMILDNLHIAPLRTQRVRAAARQFIERYLGANDLMAVVFTAGRTQDAQEFTGNKRLLLAAVDRAVGQKLDSATLTRNEEFIRQSEAEGQGARILDPEEAQRVHNTRSMLTSLKQVAEWFGGVRGRRKAILLLSEGIDYDLTDLIRSSQDSPASSASDIMSYIREAIAATNRSNVSIYSIDPRGLATTADESIGVSAFADQENPQAGIGLRSLSNELRVAQDSLRQLAEETGGLATVNRNDFSSAFDRILRDNSSYYVLAYYPPTDKRDGKFHRIEVKVNRPGLVVRARRGYAAPRGRPPAQNTKTGGMPLEMFEAINSPLPVSGMRMRAFAAPFKGPAPNASVLVGIELIGRDLSLESNSKVEVSFMAVDARARVFGPRNDSMTLNLRPETRTRIEESGFRLLNRMELPPGRYQLKIAARDSGKGNVGSVVYDLEVPDFYKEPIGISGVALASLGGGAMMTARPDDQLKAVLPAPPVAERSFMSGDEIALFAEVYDNSGSSPHKVDIITSVLTDEGRVLFKTEEQHDSSELQGARGGYGYSARVPLSEIPPGRYVLAVEARSRLGENLSATRQVRFEIVPRSPDAAPR